MLVVGIDPGLATTGYGVIRELAQGDLEVVDYGVILTPVDEPMGQRLLRLYKQLKELIILHQPESGAVEKLFFQRNVRSAMAVGQARGVVMLTLAETGLPVMEYNPMEVKQAISGYGRASKEQMQRMVSTLLRLQDIPRPDDAADALAIAICHIHSRRMTNLSIS